MSPASHLRARARGEAIAELWVRVNAVEKKFNLSIGDVLAVLAHIQGEFIRALNDEPRRKRNG